MTFPTAFPSDRLFVWAFPNCALNLLAQPSKIFRLIRALTRHRTKSDIQLSDLRPLFTQLRQTLYYLKTILFNNRTSLRYPQGKVTLRD